MNTDMTTNVAGSSAKPFTEGVKVRDKRYFIDTLLKRHEPQAPI